MGLHPAQIEAAGYRRFLARWWGILGALEPACQAFAEHPDASPLALPERRKLPLLQQDLQTLGYGASDLAALPVCARPVAFASFAEALGCLYVLEGSTLGGQLLVRGVAERCPALLPATCFLASYGREVGARWRAFVQVLTAQLARGADEEAVITASAVNTFEAFERWWLADQAPRGFPLPTIPDTSSR